MNPYEDKTPIGLAIRKMLHDFHNEMDRIRMTREFLKKSVSEDYKKMEGAGVNTFNLHYAGERIETSSKRLRALMDKFYEEIKAV